MDRSTPTSGSSFSTSNPNTNPLSTAQADAKIEGAARSAHQTVDKVADRASQQFDQLTGAAHRTVNRAADAASSATEWASTIPDQASRATNAATDAIRARPIATVFGALAVGYLLGRLARL